MDDELIKGALQLIGDSAKGFLLKDTLGPATEPIATILKSLIWRQWAPAVNETQLNLAEAVGKRRALDHRFDQRLREAMKGEEAQALVVELVQAAARATTEDRMKMLAAAAAGILTPDLSPISPLRCDHDSLAPSKRLRPATSSVFERSSMKRKATESPRILAKVRRTVSRFFNPDA